MKAKVWSFFNAMFFNLRNVFSFKQQVSLIKNNNHDEKISKYYENLLNTYLKEYNFDTIKSADIGSKNFFYAKALYQYYEKNASLVFLDGVEIDAYRRYDDFKTRFDYAMFYIKNLPNVFYFPIDFLEYEKKVNVITMFLPFVFKEPLLYWGLPLSVYQPEKLMKHAYSLLEEGGVWLISNQGEKEQKAQHQMLKNLNIPFENKGEFQSNYYTFPISHYITVVKK